MTHRCISSRILPKYTINIRWLYMTAHAMGWDRKKCLVARMDGYVTKSIQAEELFQVIERLNEEEPWLGLHCQAPESD